MFQFKFALGARQAPQNLVERRSSQSKDSFHGKKKPLNFLVILVGLLVAG
jgi:hypothetical protein